MASAAEFSKSVKVVGIIAINTAIPAAIPKPAVPTESIKELAGELENSMTKIEAPSEARVDSESEDDNN